MNKYVITGGLCVGKSSTLDVLKRRGYNVVFEISNTLINEHQKIYGKDSFPWDNGKRDKFQEECVKKQLEAESEFDKSDGIVFFDRSLIDEIAFYLNENRKVPNDLLELAKTRFYSKIFFFEALPPEFFKNDNHRPQTRETSHRIEELLMQAYQNAGYEPTIVPVTSLEKRTDYILQNL